MAESNQSRDCSEESDKSLALVDIVAPCQKQHATNKKKFALKIDKWRSEEVFEEKLEENLETIQVNSRVWQAFIQFLLSIKVDDSPDKRIISPVTDKRNK